MMENSRFQNSNFKEVFGELKSVHHVHRSKFETFVIPSILFVLFLFGVVTHIASEDWLTIPICLIVPFLLFCLVVWQLFSTSRDELRIYQNGFTLQSRKSLNACRWLEIKEFRYREAIYQNLATEGNYFPLDWIEKTNGEKIFFDHNLDGTTDIVERFESYTKEGKKRTRKKMRQTD